MASKVKFSNNLYLQMTKHTSDLFEQAFGHHDRYDPAHAPRLFQIKYLKELQAKVPDAFKQTSASHARCAGSRAAGVVSLACCQPMSSLLCQGVALDMFGNLC